MHRTALLSLTGIVCLGISGPAFAAGADEAKPEQRHNVNIGTGIYVPTSGDTSQFGIEANAWCLHAMWLPLRGAGFALDLTTGFEAGAVHFRVHWIALGVFFNLAQPVVEPNVPRTWDLLAYHGVEFRLWKGLTIKGTAHWFVPNPYEVYQTERARVDAQVNGAIAAQNPNGASNIGSDAESRVKSDYLTALAPTVNVAAVWEF